MKFTMNKNLYWLPVVLVVVAVIGVLLTLRAGNPADSNQAQLEGLSQPGGTSALTGIKGIIEYTVRDSSGRVKEHSVIHNTVNDEGKNDAFNLITGNSGSGGYSRIAALDVAVATDDPSDGVASTSITLSLDGNSGTGGDQNPASGTVTTDFATEAGNGTVDVTFTAGGSADVMQIVLTRAAEDDTSDGAVAVADNEIFAYVDVPDISLASGDSVTYTWTVDVD